MTSAEEMNRHHEEQIRILEAAQPEDRSLVGRLAAAEAELEALSGQAKEAYRRFRELDQQQDAKAAEIKELRLQIREMTAGDPS